MKTWWLGLSKDEQRFVRMGGIVLGITLIYLLIYAPLANSVVNLREQIQREQVLLGFMQESDKQITGLEKREHSGEVDQRSLFSILQTELNSSAYAQNVGQLQQADNDSVQFKMQKVGFDSVMKWLTHLCQVKHLSMVVMRVVPTGDVGIVNLEVKVKRQG